MKNKSMHTILLAGCAVIGFAATAAPVDWSKLPPAATVTGVTFDKDIEPVFKASCVRCHSGDRPRADLRLDSLAGVLKGTKKGPILTAGDSSNSLLVKAVSRLDPETAMPPKPRAHRGPHPEGGPQGTNAAPKPPSEGAPPPGGSGLGGKHDFGPPPKPLTAEQVGLVRAWIDQGAK
jgi:hypothetical protein